MTPAPHAEAVTAARHPDAEEDLLRARFYGLLSAVLIDAPDAALLDQLAALEGDDSPLGRALQALAAEAAAITPEQAADEYMALFVGLTRGELVPYASYYLTGFLNERPLAALRRDLAGLGVRRSPGRCEPEDHVGILCEVLHGLLSGATPAPPDAAARIFATHLEPWAEAFFSDLEAAPSARLYRPVGTLGRIFLDIEREATAMLGTPDTRTA